MSSARTNVSKMSKKDRDLEIMAAMAPVSAQNSAEKRDIEENNFSLLVARLVGMLSIFIAVLLAVVCMVLFSIGCCGSQTKYNQAEWEEQCNSAADNATGEKSGRWSCYHRNIYILVTFSFALYLLIVGLTFVIAGQLVYGTERAEARQEQGLDDLAAAVKANAVEQRMAERQEARILREERAAARQAAQEERRERTRAAAAADAERAEQQAQQSRNPYAGARRYSVGSPATMRMPAASQPAPVVFAPAPVRSGPPAGMRLVGRQPVVQTYAQPQVIRISNQQTAPAVVTSPQHNVQVRTNTTRYVV